MSRPRILFVDDDPRILQGLRNLLFRKRREWDMVFAESGEAALAEFDNCPFDVIISDMRMPAMDGAALLGRVREKYPDAVRIVLSGYAEREAVLQTLPVSHQYLSKPCDAEKLTRVLEHSLELRTILCNDKIRRLMGELNRLPSMSANYNRLVSAIENPLVSSRQIASIIEADAALSVKVLQLVNSSYFGLARETASIVEAVTYLGVDTVKMLAFTARMFTMVDEKSVPGFNLDVLQRRAIGGARLAHRMSGSEHAANAFTAALVRDIGQLLIAVTMPQSFRDVQATIAESGKLRHDIELEMLGFSHAQLGAYLLGLWGLPFDVVMAVAYHHAPILSASAGPVCRTVRLADFLIDEAVSQSGQSAPESRMGEDFEHDPGVSTQIEEWRTWASEAIAVHTSEPVQPAP